MLKIAAEAERSFWRGGRKAMFFSNGKWKRGLIFLFVIFGFRAAPSFADSLHGSPGAGFQRWFTSTNLNDTLNSNGSPYWDYPTRYPPSGSFPPGFPPVVTSPPGQNANVGYCLT